MSVDATQLLRMLGSGGGAQALRSSAPAAPVDQADFASLLEKARSGEITTGLPVTVEDDAGVTLTADELTRLSGAADRAEAAGVRTALVLLDGKAVLLDVHTRSVTGAAKLGEGGGGIVPGIDGMIDLRTMESGGQSPSNAGAATPTPPTAPSESMLRLLSSGIGR